MNKPRDLQAISTQFQILGEFLGAEPYGTGHINDTYCATYDQAGVTVRYIHQRINRTVFQNPESLMDNIRRVTDHLRQKLGDRPDRTRRALTLVPARDGRVFHRDPEGEYWRTYLFIERARTHDVVQSPKQAFEAAKAFGQFQRLLADMPLPRLHETIPHFHDTPARMAALEKAIEADSLGRVSNARPEIDFALSRRSLTTALLEPHRRGAIPERITHNDTKLNNVMLDDDSQEGVCVIDLDTVMPGLALYDFGDLVRTATSPALEDERDLSKVTMRLPMYEALVQGYLSTAGDFLLDEERCRLATAGKLITFEIGLRFLTDFLSGDVYFKIHRDGHNLDRCRTQFKLVESIEQQEPQMERLAVV